MRECVRKREKEGEEGESVCLSEYVYVLFEAHASDNREGVCLCEHDCVCMCMHTCACRVLEV